MLFEQTKFIAHLYFIIFAGFLSVHVLWSKSFKHQNIILVLLFHVVGGVSNRFGHLALDHVKVSDLKIVAHQTKDF